MPKMKMAALFGKKLTITLHVVFNTIALPLTVGRGAISHPPIPIIYLYYYVLFYVYHVRLYNNI